MFLGAADVQAVARKFRPDRVLLWCKIRLEYGIRRCAPVRPVAWPRDGAPLADPQETLDAVASFLNRLAAPTICLIDVGCFRGGFLYNFQSRIRGKRVFSVGIDPIRRRTFPAFSVFIEAAVANGEETPRTFYEYPDPGCNSLQRLRATRYPQGFQEAPRVTGPTYDKPPVAVRTVNVKRLSTIVHELNLDQGVIHFLKIDCQGNDLDVLLSLSPYIQQCLFVQLESIVFGGREDVLYEHQPTFDEERPLIERLGFRPVSIIPWRTPEADVVFLNTALAARLQCSNP